MLIANSPNPRSSTYLLQVSKPLQILLRIIPTFYKESFKSPLDLSAVLVPPLIASDSERYSSKVPSIYRAQTRKY